MNIEQIKKEMLTSQYDFIRNDPNLGERIMILALGGSYSYGTNIETSDIDIRGCALSNKRALLGLSSYEQVEDQLTDTVIYNINKLIPLLIKCNPSSIEMLGCKAEHYFYISPAGQMLIDNKALFLSKRAIKSFGGYAYSQYVRLKNAQIRKNDAPPEKIAEFMDKRYEQIYADLNQEFSDISFIRDEIPRDPILNLNGVRMSYANKIIKTANTKLKDLEKIDPHSSCKDDNHKNKHMMHLIRLYYMGLDILENGSIQTYRNKEHNLLMEIREGKYLRDDGFVSDDFYDMLNTIQKRWEYAINNTNLPDEPDINQIEDILIEINQIGLN